MKLDNIELHALLTEKEILTLHHANTVATSISFIGANGLLSRGGIEHNGLYQTAQSSDAIDKIFDVWNDVFIDTVDLHGYFPRQNIYGPVSFKVSIDFLLEDNYEVWITKDNPKYWDPTMTIEDKYFVSVEELKSDWDSYERHRKMVTIKNQLQPILFNYLTQVVIDDPRVETQGIHLFNEATKGLKQILGVNTTLKNKFLTRPTCTGSCFCRDNYLNQLPSLTLKRLFLPK